MALVFARFSQAVVRKQAVLIPKCNFAFKYTPSEYLVDTESTVDPKEIKVPYMKEKHREEMWQLYKSNPEENTYSVLSQKYGSTLLRTKAILYLMQRREEVMNEIGASEHLTEWGPIWARHKEVPELSAEQLGEEFSKPGAEIGQILKRMEKYTFVTENKNNMQVLIDEEIKELEDSDVDVRFRETDIDSKAVNLVDKYYPELFGDDDLEFAKKRLLRRIAKETKARVIPTVDEFLDDGVDTASTSPQHNADAALTCESRFKIAFRDLSKGNKSFRENPTMIRTRLGK